MVLPVAKSEILKESRNVLQSGESTIVYRIPNFTVPGRIGYSHHTFFFQNEITSPAATGYNSGPRSARNNGVG